MKAKNLAKILSAFLAIAMVVTLGIALRPDTAAKAAAETVTTTFDDAADIADGKAVEVWLNAEDGAVTDETAARGSEENPYALVREIRDAARKITSSITVDDTKVTLDNNGGNVLKDMTNADFAKLERIIIHVTGDAFNNIPGAANNSLGANGGESITTMNANTGHGNYVEGGSTSKIMLDFQGVPIGNGYSHIYYQTTAENFHMTDNVRFSNLEFMYLPGEGISYAGFLPTTEGDYPLADIGNGNSSEVNVTTLWVGSDVAIFGQNFQFWGAEVDSSGNVTDHKNVTIFGSTPAKISAAGGTNKISAAENPFAVAGGRTVNVTSSLDDEPQRLVSTKKEFAILSGEYDCVFAFGIGNYAYSTEKHVFQTANCTIKEIAMFSFSAQALANGANRTKFTANIGDGTVSDVIYNYNPLKQNGTNYAMYNFYAYGYNDSAYIYPSQNVFTPNYDLEINVTGDNTVIGSAAKAGSGVNMGMVPHGYTNKIQYNGTQKMGFYGAIFHTGNIDVNVSGGKVAHVFSVYASGAVEGQQSYTGKNTVTISGTAEVLNGVYGPFFNRYGAGTSFEFNIKDSAKVGLDETPDYTSYLLSDIVANDNQANVPHRMKKGLIAVFGTPLAKGASRGNIAGTTPANEGPVPVAVNISGGEVFGVVGIGSYTGTSDYAANVDLDIKVSGGTITHYLIGTSYTTWSSASAAQQPLPVAGTTIDIEVSGGTVGTNQLCSDTVPAGAPGAYTRTDMKTLCTLPDGILPSTALTSAAALSGALPINITVTGGTVTNIHGYVNGLIPYFRGNGVINIGSSTYYNPTITVTVKAVDENAPSVTSIAMVGAQGGNNSWLTTANRTINRYGGTLTLNLFGNVAGGKAVPNLPGVNMIALNCSLNSNNQGPNFVVNVGDPEGSDASARPKVTTIYGSRNLGNSSYYVNDLKFTSTGATITNLSTTQGGHTATSSSHRCPVYKKADFTIDGGKVTNFYILNAATGFPSDDAKAIINVLDYTLTVKGDATITTFRGITNTGRAGTVTLNLGKATYPDEIMVVNMDVKNRGDHQDYYELTSVEVNVQDAASLGGKAIYVPEGVTTTINDTFAWSSTLTPSEITETTSGDNTYTEDSSTSLNYDVYTCTVQPVDFVGSTVVFGSTFKARILVNKADYDAYVSAGYTLKSVTAGSNDVTADFQASLTAPYNSQYYFVLISGVAAKDIGTAVPMTITLEKTGSDDYVATWNDYSLEAALKTVAAYTDAENEAFATAAKATLAYCQAAADQFGVTASYAAGEVTHITSDTEIDEYFDTMDADVKFVGTNLVLKEELAIKFWADASGFSGSINDVKVKINGVDKTFDVEAAVNGGSKGYWTFKVAVPISEMDDNMTIELFDGATRISNAYTDSVLNYGVSCQNPDYKMSEQDKTTGQAIIDFVHYVNDYLA